VYRVRQAASGSARARAESSEPVIEMDEIDPGKPRSTGATFTTPHHEVVGFEGRWQPSDGISYGCAAVVTVDRLHNLLLGTSEPIERLDEYVEEGGVTLLERRAYVPVADAPSPYVLVVPMGHRLFWALGEGSLARANATAYVAFIYGSYESLQEDTHRAAQAILATCQVLVKDGLVLDAHNPRLNALRAVLSPGDPKLARAMARALLRTDEARTDFDALIPPDADETH